MAARVPETACKSSFELVKGPAKPTNDQQLLFPSLKQHLDDTYDSDMVNHDLTAALLLSK